MSNPAQLAANQANAQSSTGPRTPEGKAASAANANKHGFYGKHAVLLNDQERTQFESLRNSYVYALNPTTIVEVALLDLLVLAAWNIERTNRLEAEIANAEGIDPMLSETNAKTLDRILAFRARAERTFHKCHKELRALKSPARPQSKPAHIEFSRTNPNSSPPPAKPTSTPPSKPAEMNLVPANQAENTRFAVCGTKPIQALGLPPAPSRKPVYEDDPLAHTANRIYTCINAMEFEWTRSRIEPILRNTASISALRFLYSRTRT